MVKVIKEKVPKNRNLVKKIPYIRYLILLVFINILTISTVLVLKNKIPPQVPLFYGYARGDAQLTNPNGLILPNAISLIFIILNSIISYFINSDYLKKVLIISSFIATLLASITVIKIIFLVGGL